MHNESKPWKLKTLWIASALLAGSGCAEPSTTEEPQPSAQVEQKAETQDEPGFGGKLEELPFVEEKEATSLAVQQLKEPTALEENAVVHVKLKEANNEALRESLVRVVGQPESPQLLFRSDALAALGVIAESPGPEFFSTFVNLQSSELEQRVKNEEELVSLFGEDLTDRFTLFQGRRPIGIYGGIPFSLPGFVSGMPTPVNSCPKQPRSTFPRWSESLLITHPAVVQDPLRTWDPCTGAGTQGGVWTFAHLMRQMATSSGHTPENFVTQWLSLWLNNQTINGDVVPARTAMFNQVIQPWAAASGGTATLVTDASGRRSVSLSKPLNLNISPFRLIAIVNRADLGKTARGGGGYGGATTDLPVDAGELRFVFGVTQPRPWGAGGTEATCNLKPFTVIFEYGVPRTGCAAVVDWAKQWTKLNTFGGFTTAYRSHLQTLTQSVVLYNAAPTKGNRNAINQIRTNENALNSIWELREFTLTTEPSNAPVNGLLRTHTVAQTPNDSMYASIGDPTIDAFVMGPVRASTSPTTGPLPNNCSSNYTVPYNIFNWNVGAVRPFLAGNSLIPPTHWRAASANGADPRDVCARAQFSLNTCNGCHGADTSTLGAPAGNTAFTHISPTSGIPAQLSYFLTGGGTGMMLNVPDTQFGFGRPNWRFADLDRRFRRLYDLAYCTNCNRISVFHPALLDRVAEISGVVPIDPIGPVEKPQFEVGPIRDIEVVRQLLEVRPEFNAGFRDEPVDFIREAEFSPH